jgi:hypothetical protein
MNINSVVLFDASRTLGRSRNWRRRVLVVPGTTIKLSLLVKVIEPMVANEAGKEETYHRKQAVGVIKNIISFNRNVHTFADFKEFVKVTLYGHVLRESLGGYF